MILTSLILADPGSMLKSLRSKRTSPALSSTIEILVELAVDSIILEDWVLVNSSSDSLIVTVKSS